MLKIGYFSHSNFSPSETFIYDLVKALSKEKDIDITYVTGKSTPLITDFPVKSIATNYSEQSIVWAQRLYKIGQIKGENGYKWQTCFKKKIAQRQLNKAKLPLFDVAYIDYGTSAVLISEYLKEKKIPFIVHVHGFDVSTALNDPTYKKDLLQLFSDANHIITPSNHIARILVTLGCPKSKLSAIYPVTNFDKIDAQTIKQKTSHPSIVFLGRLTEKKNPIALLHAFELVSQTIPNATLEILGDGPLRGQLINRINACGLQGKVTLHGIVNQQQAFKILQQSHIYVQHSVTATTGDQEGFPVSLAEAAAHGLPIVSTIHSGITENVINGETGYLVQEYDYETMAEKIICLINDPTLAQKLGMNGRKHILELCKPGLRTERIKTLLYEASQEYKSH